MAKTRCKAARHGETRRHAAQLLPDCGACTPPQHTVCTHTIAVVYLSIACRGAHRFCYRARAHASAARVLPLLPPLLRPRYTITTACATAPPSRADALTPNRMDLMLAPHGIKLSSPAAAVFAAYRAYGLLSTFSSLLRDMRHRPTCVNVGRTGRRVHHACNHL